MPLSPYAATKATKELYAKVFAATYDVHVTGLRYFNVFGPRQNPQGPYAAVIPKWVQAFLDKDPVVIYGDGKTSRDFCFVENAIQANILGAVNSEFNKSGEIYNIAAEKQTTLFELQEIIAGELKKHNPSLELDEPVFEDFRAGDVRHSLASVEKARTQIGYQPEYTAREGLEITCKWFYDKATMES